jgi:hypothetical protein
VIAQHHEHQTLIAVQCETTTGNQTFRLSQGCESPSPPGRNEWFILIALRGATARPDFFIVPRNVMAAYLHVGHRAWLAAAGEAEAAPAGHDAGRRAFFCDTGRGTNCVHAALVEPKTRRLATTG